MMKLEFIDKKLVLGKSVYKQLETFARKNGKRTIG